MKTVPFTAHPRTQGRRGGSKQLRSKGRIPAVIYGANNKPQSVEVDKVAFGNLIGHSVSENLLLDLTLGEDKGKRLVLLKDVQHHPLSGDVLHVDLHEVSENEKVTAMVPVETVGEAAGVKTGGGILEHVLFKVKVRALPRDLPEVIEVDVSHLEIGQTMHLGDIKVAEGVELLGDKKVSVISVAEPITEAQEAAAAEATATPGEVEMIKEKKEEAGAEGAAPAKGGEKAAAAPAAEKKPAEKKK